MKDLLIVERQNIVAIANAIRSKTNTLDVMTLNKMIEEINNIEIGRGSLSQGMFAFEVEEDYEPGVNLYNLTTSGLNSSNRLIIVVEFTIHNSGTGGTYTEAKFVAYRNSLDEDFKVSRMQSGDFSIMYLPDINENSIELIGNCSYGDTITQMRYIAI